MALVARVLPDQASQRRPGSSIAMRHSTQRVERKAALHQILVESQSVHGRRGLPAHTRGGCPRPQADASQRGLSCSRCPVSAMLVKQRAVTQ